MSEEKEMNNIFNQFNEFATKFEDSACDKIKCIECPFNKKLVEEIYPNGKTDDFTLCDAILASNKKKYKQKEEK